MVVSFFSVPKNSTTSQSPASGSWVKVAAGGVFAGEAASAGEIVAVVGLKKTTTGDTLCQEESPILLEKMHFPESVISMAIEPATKADQDKLSNALRKMQEEDPSFNVIYNQETAQTLISWMGELHLDFTVERIRR